MSELAVQTSPMKSAGRPRLGFLGVGWIGRNRLEAIAQSGAGEIVAIADPVHEMAVHASPLAPGAALIGSLDELLDLGIDGLVIATPSALHAQQAIAALEKGVAVFCQKPLGRDQAETHRVIEAARHSNRLLAVDLSYRFITGMQSICDLIRAGELGQIYAINLIFHNAYGPDKAWFYDPRLSGGGCVIDLGIHLVDLALWALDFPHVVGVSSRLFAQGFPLHEKSQMVEDYAIARLDLESGTTVQLACSWKLHAGCDAVIEASFYGTHGGASLRNIGGSFYDFSAERFAGTAKSILSTMQDGGKNWEWGGQAAINWAQRLATGEGFDAAAEHLIAVSATLDAIYGRPQRRDS